MRSLVADLVALRLVQLPQGPMNSALYRILREAIYEGRLAGGTRLPASRDLSAELAVARNTVVHAYTQLQAEGYVVVRPGNGTFVADMLPEGATHAAMPAWLRAARGASVARAPTVSRRGQHLLRNASAARHQGGAFTPGAPDVTLLPRERLTRLFRDAWRNPDPALLNYAHHGGLPALKSALSDYLSVSRSLDCTPGQVIVTEGAHQAIELITRLLADVGDTVWVEDPGYWGARSILQINGVQIQGMPVDGEGMCLPQTMPEVVPKFIFLTPSHQYPLGPVMSMARRLQILSLARQWGAWVIEDDYDSEMRFAGRPIAAMQGLEPDAPVVYLGTFSKTLYPGLRLGYLVVPTALADAFQRAQNELYREGHYMTQTAIASFIEQGDYARHIRRMRLLYGQRRAMLVNLIERRLGQGWLHGNGSDAGLHLVIDLPEGMDDLAVEHDLQVRGVVTRALSRYYLDRATARPGLLLGYACVPESQMAASFEVVVAVLAEHVQAMRRPAARASSHLVGV